MIGRSRLLFAPLSLALVAVAIAACGGGAAIATPPRATDASATTLAPGEASAVPLPAETTAGGPASSPDAPAGGDSGSAGCDLLTAAEVADANGADVTETLGGSAGPGQTACTFTGAYGSPILSYLETTPESPISPQQAFDAFLSMGEAVSGIGDRAMWVTLPGTELGTLYVLAKGNLLSVMVSVSDPNGIEEHKQASVELARLAIDRL
jgi:hypothetical protein